MTSYLKNGSRHEQVKQLKISTMRNTNPPVSVFFTNLIIFEITEFIQFIHYLFPKYRMSIKEHISRVLWNSNTFDFCRFVAYCVTK
jgi:hypothetical protein